MIIWWLLITKTNKKKYFTLTMLQLITLNTLEELSPK